MRLTNLWRIPGVFVMVAVTAGASLAGELAPEVRAALDKVRGTRAGLYDTFESSVLGKTATPSEMAATQRDWRAFYSQPATQLPAPRPRPMVANKRLRIAGAAKGTTPLFPVATLPTAPPLPEVKPIPTTTRAIPSTPTWDLQDLCDQLEGHLVRRRTPH
jgi:hypothetical protein